MPLYQQLLVLYASIIEMNERIKLLWEQSAQRDDIHNVTRQEKFAELIVQECCDIVEKNLYQNIGWNTSRAVRRHFGLGPEE
jgi:hypothetical protein